MVDIVAYCGLTCKNCPIYLATKQENKEEQARMRAEIVKLCEKKYGIHYRLEDITDCDGCRMEGARLFSPSRNCSIQMCAKEKKLENCAYCPGYVCGTLNAFFIKETTAKARLDEIKRRIL
jgi:hypothetical protein